MSPRVRRRTVGPHAIRQPIGFADRWVLATSARMTTVWHSPSTLSVSSRASASQGEHCSAPHAISRATRDPEFRAEHYVVVAPSLWPSCLTVAQHSPTRNPSRSIGPEALRHLSFPPQGRNGEGRTVIIWGCGARRPTHHDRTASRQSPVIHARGRAGVRYRRQQTWHGFADVSCPIVASRIQSQTTSSCLRPGWSDPGWT